MKLEKFIEEKEADYCQEHNGAACSIDAGLINGFYDLVKDRGYESEDGLYRESDLEEAWTDALEETGADSSEQD